MDRVRPEPCRTLDVRGQENTRGRVTHRSVPHPDCGTAPSYLRHSRPGSKLTGPYSRLFESSTLTFLLPLHRSPSTADTHPSRPSLTRTPCPSDRPMKAESLPSRLRPSGFLRVAPRDNLFRVVRRLTLKILFFSRAYSKHNSLSVTRVPYVPSRRSSLYSRPGHYPRRWTWFIVCHPLPGTLLLFEPSTLGLGGRVDDSVGVVSGREPYPGSTTFGNRESRLESGPVDPVPVDPVPCNRSATSVRTDDDGDDRYVLLTWRDVDLRSSSV